MKLSTVLVTSGLYASALAALTIARGDMMPATAFGPIDSMLLGWIDLLVTGLIAAAAVGASLNDCSSTMLDRCLVRQLRTALEVDFLAD